MSQMRLVFGLARREALERLRSRAFQISTVIVLLAAVAAVVLPSVFLDEGPTTFRVGVTAGVAPGVEQTLVASGSTDVVLEVEDFPDRATGEAALNDGLDVLVATDSEMVWAAQPDVRLESLVRSAMTQAQLAGRADELGLDPGELSELMAPARIESTTLTEDGTDQRRGPQALIATVGMILLFVSITYYGSHILMSVIEEKQNRVIEVLLAHVEPRHLLAAKVLGHGALGLAQITALALIAGIGLVVFDPIDVPQTAFGAVAGAVMWFILGYAFYSVLYGALGSLASRTEDAQSAIGPLTIVLMAAYFLTFSIIDNPASPIAVVGSFLPPTAPLMMPLRTALTDVPIWQVATSVGIQVVSIYGLVRVGGRLYRGAVLKIGRKLSIREAWNATAGDPA